MAKKPTRPTEPTEECSYCGALFRRGRTACPECGSDARTGWQSDGELDYQSVEIPDYYEEPPPKPPRRRRVLVVVVIGFLVLALGGVVSVIQRFFS